MQISSFATATVMSAVLFLSAIGIGIENMSPSVPDAGIAHAASAALPDLPAIPTMPEEVANPADTGAEQNIIERGVPTSLRIPSIGLDVPVVPVGVNERGEMAVPDGATENVGWYENGTVPGSMGSAVLDAHVYAAFKNLRRAQPGDEIYINMSNGDTLRYVVAESIVHALETISTEALFNRSDAVRLNLITCEGNWDATRDTYDHRRIVYATLAE